MTKEGESNHQTITNETLMISAAAISAFCSFFVVLSSILFPAMRKKKFTQLIFLMSTCDMFGNIFAAFGFPKNTSPLCPIQGALRTFFYRASWFWSVVLTYQLFCTVCFGIIGVSKKVAHICVWSLSILLLVLPLSTNEYGQDDQISGIGWCSLAGNTLDAGIWLLISSQIPVSIAILCNVWYVYQMDRFVSKNFSDISKYPQITTALKTLRLYPIVMIIAWLPSTVMGPLINFRGVPINENTIFYMGLTEAWGGLFGFGLFAIFFTKNKEAIFYWGLLWAYVKASISGGDTASTLEGLFGRSNNLGDAATASNTIQNAGNIKTSSLNRPLFNKFSQIPTKGIFIDNDDDAFNYYTGSSNNTNTTGNTIFSKMFSSREGSSSYRSQMDSTHSRNSVSHFKGFAREQSLESHITSDSSIYSNSNGDSRNNQDIISNL